MDGAQAHSPARKKSSRHEAGQAEDRLRAVREMYLQREASAVVRHFARILGAVVPFQHLTVALLRPSSRRLRVLDASPTPGEGPLAEHSIPVAGTAAATVLRQGRTLVVPSARKSSEAPRLAPLFPALPESAAVVPLTVDKRPLGTLNVGCDPAGLGTESVRLLEELAAHLAVALENASSYHRSRQSEERYRALLEKSADATFVLDLDQRRIVEVNARALDLTGYGRSELLSLEWESLGELLQELPWFSLLRRALGGERVSLDATLVTATGDHLPVHLRASVLQLGQCRALHCELRDLSEQARRAEPWAEEVSPKLLESANTFLCCLDERGRVGFSNRKCQEMTGTSAIEAAGTEFTEWLAPRARHDIGAKIRAAFEGGSLDSLELPLLGQGGREIHLSVSSSLLGEGADRQLLLVGTDISQVKRFQSNLVASEKRSKSAYLQMREFSAVSSAILQEVDLDRICCKFVDALREHSNFSRAILTLLNEEFRGHKWFFAGLDDDEIELFHRNRLSGDQRITIFQERFRMGNSYYIPHDSGWDYVGVPSQQDSAKTLDWNPEDFLFIPLYGSNRKMVGIVSVDDPKDGARPTAESVSPVELFANQVAHAIEQARLNQAVRRSTEKYRTLVESMNDGLLAVDLTNRVTFVNPALLELLGQPEMLVLNERIHRFLAPGEQEIFRSEVRQRERRSRFELRLLARSGEVIPVAVSSAPFYQSGQLVGTFAIVSDLREQKQAEAESEKMHQELVASHERLQDSLKDLKKMQEQLIQAEKLSALGELISGVAHELNNPLTGVMGYSQLLLGAECSDSVKSSLKKVHGEAIRCQKIVQNLLQFARRHNPEKVAVSVNEVLDATLELRRYQLNVDNIEVVRELDERLPETTGDFHQLQQVFLNIINNAHQAMVEAHGRGRLILRTRRDGDTIRVLIMDDGPGVPEEKIGKIFDPFFTTKDPGKGTGLGLSLSYGIVRDHDGEIRARSTFGEGTTFEVELPIRSPDAPDQVEDEEDLPLPAATGSRILVVDDERVILDLLGTILESGGHRVDMAANGQRALEMLRHNRYDLIISDMKMPDVGGQVLWESVHAIDPEMSRRIIFSTGDTVNPTTRAFFERTGNLYLSKPFRVEEVDRMVRKALAELPSSSN